MIQHYIILGGGPVGCYLAYKLLSQNNSRITIFEKKKFERPQALRIPFCIAADLPLEVKKILWNDQDTRSRIFNPCFIDDIEEWPKLSYYYWPFISIRSFQESMIQFLKNNYRDDFNHIEYHDDLTQLNLQEYIQNSVSAVYCTCGTYAKSLRKTLNLLDGKLPENKGHGIYLIYQNNGPENYKRNGSFISSTELGEKGITYAATNNRYYDVQLYTYPVSELLTIFNDIPAEFIHKTQYSGTSNAINMTGTTFSGNTKKWFKRYKDKIKKIINDTAIQLPVDLSQIKVFYAQRTEYYWSIVSTQLLSPEKIIPLFFIGDSAGSTDYKLGLSLGRGFISVQALCNFLLISNYDFKKVLHQYQNYWQTILQREFNKGQELITDPYIQYQHMIKGREFIFPDNKKIIFSEHQYKEYLNKHSVLI